MLTKEIATARGFSAVSLGFAYLGFYKSFRSNETTSKDNCRPENYSKLNNRNFDLYSPELFGLKPVLYHPDFI